MTRTLPAGTACLSVIQARAARGIAAWDFIQQEQASLFARITRLLARMARLVLYFRQLF
jgi:hypothetical protein